LRIRFGGLPNALTMRTSSRQLRRLPPYASRLESRLPSRCFPRSRCGGHARRWNRERWNRERRNSAIRSRGCRRRRKALPRNRLQLRRFVNGRQSRWSRAFPNHRLNMPRRQLSQPRHRDLRRPSRYRFVRACQSSVVDGNALRRRILPPVSSCISIRGLFHQRPVASITAGTRTASCDTMSASLSTQVVPVTGRTVVAASIPAIGASPLWTLAARFWASSESQSVNRRTTGSFAPSRGTQLPARVWIEARVIPKNFVIVLLIRRRALHFLNIQIG